MHSGRPAEALALLRDDVRPSRVPAEFAAAARSTANALLGQEDPSTAIEQNLKYLRSDSSESFTIMLRCAALGDLGSAFELLDGYFFGAGTWARLALNQDDMDRYTAPLFEPPMKAAWQDMRFARLLNKIGLEEYWRRSGTAPDFRR